MLKLAIAHGTPPRRAIPRLLSLRDWELNLTSNKTILSPSGKKKRISFPLLPVQAHVNLTMLRGMHKPRFPCSEPACGKLLVGTRSCVSTCGTAEERASPLASSRRLGWHTSAGELKARQLGFQGGNGSVSFRSFAALWEEVASSYLPDRGIHVN